MRYPWLRSVGVLQTAVSRRPRWGSVRLRAVGPGCRVSHPTPGQRRRRWRLTSVSSAACATNLSATGVKSFRILFCARTVRRGHVVFLVCGYCWVSVSVVFAASFLVCGIC